jgi:predicted metal-dependent RNase
MRATDAVEKVSRDRPELLRPYKKELLGLMQETAGVLRGEADLRAEERASGAGTSKAVKKPEAVWSEATITKGERVLRGEADLRAEARASGAGTSKAVKKSEAVWSEATVTKGERLFRAEADLRAEARASGAGTSKAVKKPEAVWSEATITKEVRWHMAQISARLPLNARERRTAVAALRSYLEDRSSIVRTFALQALADLANRDADLRSEVIQLLHEATRSGTPAMKARSRKLLLRLEQSREEE